MLHVYVYYTMILTGKRQKGWFYFLCIQIAWENFKNIISKQNNMSLVVTFKLNIVRGTLWRL